MKKNYQLFFTIIVVCLIFPSIYLYRYLFPPRIIPAEYKNFSTTPAEYAIAQLGKEIIKKAQEKKLAGYISSLQHIFGEPDTEIDSLKKDINLAVAQYTGWKVIAPEEQLVELRQRKTQDLARKKSLIETGFIDPETYTRFLIESERININYDLMAEWKWLPASKENCKIIVSVLNRSTGKIDFTTEVAFTHPLYFKIYKTQQQVILYGTYISSSVFLVTILSFFVFITTRKKLEKQIPQVIEKCKDYIEKGAYTSAEKLVTKWLRYFPENTELTAFLQRLQIITNNNPYEAEKAYIKFVNLRTKLQQGGILSQQEYNELKNLPNILSLPEITKTIADYEKYIKNVEIEKQILSKQEYLKMLVEKGELEKAKTELEMFYKSNLWNEYVALLPAKDKQTETPYALPPKESFENIQINIEEKIRIAKDELEKAKELISRIEIRQAKEVLNNIIKINKNLTEASELLEKIELSQNTEKLCLEPQKIGKKVFMFKKDTIIFARKDKKFPDVDINDLRISRDNHLKLCVVEDKLIAEDLNSTNGTYYHGEKISRIEIENGDILNLAGVYEITIYIYRGSKDFKPTIVSAGSTSQAVKPHQIETTKLKKLVSVYIKAKDRDIIIFPNKEESFVPVVFTPIGIDYQETGDCFLYVKDNVIVLKTPQKNPQILCPETEIEYKGIKYKIV